MAFIGHTQRKIKEDYLFFRTFPCSLNSVSGNVCQIYLKETRKRSKGGGDGMDAQAVGHRIKVAREAKGLTQEELAVLVDLSPTHISVIERGVKVPNLDSFVAIANALGVSADALLIDVVECSTEGIANELSTRISKLPQREQRKILGAVQILTED